MDNHMTLPVFPLPEVIFFPRTMLPLHIFEERYRKMIKDLLTKPDDERLVVITKLNNQNQPLGQNPFESIGTVGRLVHVEYLDDGRSNVVLLGQNTVRIEEILPSPEPYRMCEIKEIREEYWKDPLGDHQKQHGKLMNSINRFMERSNSQIKNLDDVGTEDLINGLSSSLNISPDEKQKLLSIQEIDDRLNMLVEILDQIGYYSEFEPDKDEYKGIN